MKRKIFASFSSLPKLLPFAPLLAAVLGCSIFQSVESDKIPQDEIRQSYQVRASKNGTTASATFSRGNWGASVDLDAPSRIDSNGAEMAQRSNLIFAGVFYARDYAGVEKSHEFVYTNNDGKVFRNSVTLEPVELAEGTVTIDRSAETRVLLSRPLSAEESMHIVVRSSKAPPESNSNSNKTLGPNEPLYEVSLNDELDSSRAAIILKPKDFKRLVAGAATLVIEVTKSSDLKEKTSAGGTIGYTYESKRDAEIR